MLYEKIKKDDAKAIKNLSADELGWTSSTLHLEEVLEKYPGIVAREDGEIIGFAYSNPISGDILKISNMVVRKDCRHQGIGSELLSELEKDARHSGYRAFLFAQDPEWFSPQTFNWLEEKGYRDVYATDQSSLMIKEN